MRKLKLIIAAMGIVVGAGAAAHAAPGYSTANVNMRAGPDIDFPRVNLIPEGTPVDIRGCLSDESWCDVVWGGSRGWVVSEYLAFEYRGQYMPLPDIGLTAIRIPAIRFVANDYWGRHYTKQPWYGERNRWYAFKPRPRPGWRAPPPGQRKPGWWRADYKPFAGMKPPQETWSRSKQRDDRRR
ncbi:SH3 domain-containing protein [Hyphomicrobium sp. CS1GBMeth3]|uniref:SH3 domain-containing protein n=1 Tax=Hyphomicrobium sp. CS1GBMeth3 TaxID=1892845 RepID=UPI000A8EFEDF|nr:SH3 domain-containing protein [Hyphomicrobium sp. CS1GBMeth3]